MAISKDEVEAMLKFSEDLDASPALVQRIYVPRELAWVLGLKVGDHPIEEVQRKVKALGDTKGV